jgi:hypothetical protein
METITADSSRSLQLSPEQMDHISKYLDINDSILDSVRTFWQECVSTMLPGATHKIHREANCWWHLYQDTDAWRHYERGFALIKVISALNGGKCVTKDSVKALKYETESLRIVFQCTQCQPSHNVSRTLNQAGFLFMRTYDSVDELSAMLMPTGAASHLC